jgi:hypothetical protein
MFRSVCSELLIGTIKHPLIEIKRTVANTYATLAASTCHAKNAMQSDESIAT